MTITSPSAAAPLAVAAAAHFRARLRFETDVSDVAAALDTGEPGFVLVDSRGHAAWAQGRLPGAAHVPTATIPQAAPELLAPGTPVVVYCWGPGCNGAQKAALAFAELGHPVREMLGGFEYWAREGLPVETDAGVDRRVPDPLTAPSTVPVCDC
ncbi:rhodanese-like domain-containing protein [Naasia sp. SYSU D00057]|uniref:rhodanese-like domain-containing protein n=1 Tax=Naasia sp. SYSU D00057 TaxID=2817380 RepID=UPI001B30E308|nr:rhodanese-like domain-containing protein [Naasia sp. SYSU D00057]